MYRVAFLFVFLATPLIAADKRAMVVEDLFRFKRVADPQISPDGKLIVYQLTTVNLDENKSSTNLWIADVSGKSLPRQLTNTTKSDRHPRWSPDGKKILFESTRSGENQLWVIDLSGGEAKQLTTISTGASNGTWSPDGKVIAFMSAVYPENSAKPFKEADELNKKKMDEIAKSPVKAKVFKRLFFRHWDEYVEDKRNHLFIVNSEGGEPKNVTPGDRDAYPTSTTFSVGDEFVFSPNSKYLVFTAVPNRDEAWSTDHNICRVPVTGGSIEEMTKANKAADNSPRFSPDGKKLAYRAQKKSGYEADKWDILVCDCDEDGAIKGEPRNMTSTLDRSVDEFIWAGIWNRSATGTGFIFATDEGGSHPLYGIASSGDIFPASLSTQGQHTSLSASKDGSQFSFALAQMSSPSEVYTDSLAQEKTEPAKNVSIANRDFLAQLDLPKPESVEVEVEDGKMQMWILKPPGFDPSKKWPVAYLIHGGPQSAWENGWSFRWNAEIWAAQGYVVVMPNPRGSTGFGQKFVDQISGDWGGKCYRDLMKGADYVEKLPYVDKDRIASAGASFGGYMMNWFAVNTGRFKCLITHCSVWNFESMWGTTDELWFDEYEHGGLPWDKPKEYEKYSPHKKAGNLGKFKTPMLIIHNDYDFRCPIGQGHELFSALQRQGVPSRFVNFPDEGHWVLKPKNSQFWHQEVFSWLKKYCPPGGKE